MFTLSPGAGAALLLRGFYLKEVITIFDVYFYSFSKRENSTKIPTGEADEHYRCKLKDGCSIYSPVIILEGMGNPAELNYCYIPVWNKYYFVTNWQNVSALWYASCTEDVLATWRTEIGNSEQYILRSAHAFDGTVMDTVYPAVNQITRNTAYNTGAEGLSIWKRNLSDGTYVVGVINSDQSGYGAVKYYVLNQTQFDAFNHTLLGDVDWLDIDFSDFENLDENLFKAQFNPFQYIVSCNWFPFQAPISESGTSNIKYGWWELQGVSASRLSPVPLHSLTCQFTIPKHPQAASRGSYLNLSPYSQYQLNIPPFGIIPIDSTLIADAATLYGFITVDCVSGSATLSLSTQTGGGNIITRVNGCVGVPMKLAQMSTDYVNAASTAVQSAAGVARSLLFGNKAGAALGAVSGIASTATAMLPQMQTSGNVGSISEYFFNPQLTTVFHHVANEDITHRGRPLMADRIIKNIPGYIVCADGDIQLPATSGELTAIKSYLEGGFFFE